MSTLLLILNSFRTILYYFISIWWLWLPVFLYFVASTIFQNYTLLKYRLSLEWVLLEIKVPKEINKSPKAMEQIFVGLHGIYSSSVKTFDRIFKGKIPDWYSFEIVGKGGQTSFYIRTQKKYRNIVESNIYAQYPDVEIIEVPDYINDTALDIPNDKFDVWGTDLMLNKEDAYPIRTYPDFEEKGSGPDIVKRIDPLASLTELFSSLHSNEQIWIQILGAPTGDDWIKRGQLVRDKLMGREVAAPSSDFLSDAIFAIDKAISGIAAAPTEEKKEKKEEKKKVDLTSGQQDAIKSMEKSWDKFGYQTCIRFLYIGPREDFHQTHAAGIIGSFRQFSSQNLNGFKPNMMTLTYSKGLFKASKLFTKKRSIFQNFRDRKLFGTFTRPYVLNTEELATVFHFPDTGVKTPLLPRVEAKKGEPPVGLPIT